MKLENCNRIRSASLGRSRDYERLNRYWTFLFDHLNRVTDEIYKTCEEDESIDQCKETILTLQNHIRDFESLIQWLKLNKNLQTTPKRPSSVSWEVKKRLPKRSLWPCYFDCDFDTQKARLSDPQLELNNTEPLKQTHLLKPPQPTQPSSPASENKIEKTLKQENSKSPTVSKNGLSKLQTQENNINVNVNKIVNSNEQNNPTNHLVKPTVINVQLNSWLKKPKFNFPLTPEKNPVLNKCNTTVNRSSKYEDEDGFQLVRYRRERNKVTQLKIIDHCQTNDNGCNGSSSTEWAGLGNLEGDNKAPCRTLLLREKFFSPSRKRPTYDTLKKQKEKQAKAQEARERLLEQKAGKFKGIVKKVEEIKAQKEEQQMQLKLSMEMRLQRADEKRQQQLNKIVRKAHDEDAKVNEILFINLLEADSKKHEIISKGKVHELRLQDLQEERQRKLEEKASKEAAFEKRRQAIEAEKQARIEKLKEQRKMKLLKVEQQLQEKEKERLELAFQKELDRKLKLSALNALHAAEKEELQKKILAKQEESKRRHEENMEQIRLKALELSVRKSSAGVSDEALVCVPYDTVKMCALCKVVIKSEVYLFGHLRGKRHNDAIIELNEGKIPSIEKLENYNLCYIIEASSNQDGSLADAIPFSDCDSEQLKQARKKSKKLKQKLISRVTRFEDKNTIQLGSENVLSNEVKSKLSKICKELISLQSSERISGQWPANMIRALERQLSELEKHCLVSQSHCAYFHCIGGLVLLTNILSRILNGTTERPTSLTDNANCKLATVYKVICGQSWQVCHYFIQSNCIISLLDILYHRLNLCINSNVSSSFPYDPVVGSLCDFFSSIFDTIYCQCSFNHEDRHPTLVQHIKDIINYLVIMGVIDKLSILLSSIRGTVNELPQQSLFVKQILTFFCAISQLLTLFPSCRCDNIEYGVKLTKDDTQFMLTLKVNQLCGIVTMLYGFLLHSGSPVRNATVPATVPDHTLQVALQVIRFLNYISLLDISFVQSILGGEGLSLQIRHICSYLIWYCSHHLPNSDLLHEVILLIGNFVVLNSDNQTLLQSGQRPTVVQQLCSLPFEYFSEPTLMKILFPTLVVCCFHNDDNVTILRQEMSATMLSSYIDQTIVNSQLEQVENCGLHKTIVTERWAFAIRFPKNKWNEAKFYFDDMK